MPYDFYIKDLEIVSSFFHLKISSIKTQSIEFLLETEHENYQERPNSVKYIILVTVDKFYIFSIYKVFNEDDLFFQVNYLYLEVLIDRKNSM